MSANRAQIVAIEDLFGVDLWVFKDGHIYCAAEAQLQRLTTGGYFDE